MNKAFLQQVTKLFAQAKDGQLYSHGRYFWIAHGHRYALAAPSHFWEKSVEKSKKIRTLGAIERYGLHILLDDPQWLGATLRFAQASDRYHGKTWRQYCIAAKIPVFWRNHIVVIVKDGKIVQVFR